MIGNRVVIIGAGFAGLASAALLAKAGFKVTVIEKNEQPGGRASLWETNGFKFDMGPSWYLMPDVFERFFALFDKKPTDYYTLTRIDPHYRIFFSSDEIIDIPADVIEVCKLFDKLEPSGGQKLKDYLAASKYQYEIAVNKFLYRNYASFTDLLDRQLMTEGLKLNVFSKMEKYVKKYFTSDIAQKIIEYNLVFLGGDPKHTPALYSLMAHVDFNLGVWYPTGGLNAVAQGLYKLGQELGVEYIFNEAVEHIEIKDASAKRVITDHATYDADQVLVNADYHFAETNFLPRESQSYSAAYWDKRVVAPSMFIMYLGVNKKLPRLEHHNLFLEHNWQPHFDTIFEKPSWPDAPSYYVCMASKTDPTIAPTGMENVFILVPVAPGLSDPEAFRNEYAQKTIEHLEKVSGENIKEHIVVQRIFTQRDFSARYNAFKGTALGLSHTLFQTALFRPAIKSRKVGNLFYTGQYTHPGIGVPMTLISAEIAANEIIKNHDGKQTR